MEAALSMLLLFIIGRAERAFKQHRKYSVQPELKLKRVNMPTAHNKYHIDQYMIRDHSFPNNVSGTGRCVLDGEVNEEIRNVTFRTRC